MSESPVGLAEVMMETLCEDPTDAWGGMVWFHLPGLSGEAFSRARRGEGIQ